MSKNKLIIMKLYLSTAFFICIFFNLFPQSILNKANNYHDNLEYYTAIKYYKKYLRKHQPDLDIAQKLANCYSFTNNYKEEEFWYWKILSLPKHDSAIIYNYALALKKNGKYKDAKENFLLYGSFFPKEKMKTEALMAYCDTAMTWMENDSSIQVNNEVCLNSDYSDFSPAFYDHGIVFTSDRKIRRHFYFTKNLFGWT